MNTSLGWRQSCPIKKGHTIFVTQFVIIFQDIYRHESLFRLLRFQCSYRVQLSATGFLNASVSNCVLSSAVYIKSVSQTIPAVSSAVFCSWKAICWQDLFAICCLCGIALCHWALTFSMLFCFCLDSVVPWLRQPCFIPEQQFIVHCRLICSV